MEWLLFIGTFEAVHLGNVGFRVENEAFYGKVEDVNDLVTFEGDSVKTLKESFVEAVEDYLETCREIGKEPQKSYKGSFNIRISSELHKKAAHFANKKRISLNDFVKKAISYAIENEKGLDGI